MDCSKPSAKGSDAAGTRNSATRKPILTVEQQIDHLKEKGVKFELCDENKAARYLSEKCNFFKLASYRKLFSKREGGERDGQYVNLDFAQLRLLASLDQRLRRALLGMTLDIEHFQKMGILREVETRGENGYSIVSDYMGSLGAQNKEHRLHELGMNSRSPYSTSIYSKYFDDMPVWVFLELTSFGTLIDFSKFCADRWGDRALREAHYDLKRIKSIRNCAAHNSCLINCFADRDNAPNSASRRVTLKVSATGFPKATRRKWMGNTAMQEVATVLVAYAATVPDGFSKERASRNLDEVFSRLDREVALLPDAGPDAIAYSALMFLRRLTVSLGLVK